MLRYICEYIYTHTFEYIVKAHSFLCFFPHRGMYHWWNCPPVSRSWGREITWSSPFFLMSKHEIIVVIWNLPWKPGFWSPYFCCFFSTRILATASNLPGHLQRFRCSWASARCCPRAARKAGRRSRSRRMRPSWGSWLRTGKVGGDYLGVSINGGIAKSSILDWEFPL